MLEEWLWHNRRQTHMNSLPCCAWYAGGVQEYSILKRQMSNPETLQLFQLSSCCSK